MAGDAIIQGVLQAERGDHRGDSLDASLQALTDDLNRARRKAEAEGQDDAGIFGAMRQAWEAHDWETRYAHLLAISAQWFTVSAQHNFDRVPIQPRLMSTRTLSGLFLTVMLLGAPELERAMDHQTELHREAHPEEEWEEGEACGCFDTLIHHMKIEPYFEDNDDPAKVGGIQRGEA